jgi:ligand-binding sensor domain-containing protein
MQQLANIFHKLSSVLTWLSGFCCCLLLNLPYIHAQKQYKRTQLTTEKGLAHNYCHALIKDTKGFLWFGTQDGLSRFDGYNFKNFRHDDTDSTSISSNIISGIAADKNGKFWVTMNGGGLNCFDPLSVEFTGFQHFVTPVHPITKITGFAAKSVRVDRHQGIWIGTYNNGLYAFNPQSNTFKQYDLGTPLEILTDAFKFNSVNDLIQDFEHDDLLWIANNDQRHSLSKLDKKTQKITHFPIKAPAISLFMDKPNELWVGTWSKGLAHFNTTTNSIEYFGDDLPNLGKDPNTNVITSITRRNDHELWVTSMKNGLWVFDELKKKFYDLPELNTPQAPIFGNETGGVFADKSSDRIWFWDKERGVTGFKENPNWLNYHTIEECAVIHRNEVNSFVWDDQTQRLFLTMSGCHVLAAFDKNYKQLPLKGLEYTVFYPSGKKDKTETFKNFNCLWMDKITHKLWLGSDFSKDSPFTLFELDPVSLTLTPLSIKALNDLNIHQNTIKDLIQDSNNCFWIATSKLGLIRFNPMTQQVLIVPNTEKMDIGSLKEDAKNNIWVTTKGNGIIQINGKTGEVKQYPSLFNGENSSKSKFLLDANVTQEAEDGTIWVGTNNHGIVVIDPQKPTNQSFTVYNLDDGLPDLTVTNIVRNTEGGLWLSTLDGLCFFDAQKKEFHRLNCGETVEDLKMRRKGLAFGAQNTLLLGLNKNFLSIQLDKKQAIPPTNLPIQFTDFKIFEKSVSFNKPLNDVEKIDLQPDQNFFTVFFSAMTLTPDNVNYRYKIEGFDKNWIYAGTRNSATYTNLPDGTHTLQVQCTDEEGMWQAQTAALRLTIIAPFYRTWWFLSLMFLLIGSLAYGLYQFRVQQIRDKEMLKTTLNKRISEVKMEALRAQMNPHFIFNSLSSINLFILKNEAEAASLYLNKFSRLIRQVLDHSRSETITLAEDLETLTLYVEMEKVRFGKQFNYSFDIDNQLDTNAIVIPPLLIQPFVENAIWHGLKHKTTGEPLLKIRVWGQDKTLFIEVEDNGIGRKQSAEIKKQSALSHTPHGLNVTAERIALFNEAYSTNAHIEIQDLENIEGVALGTKVVFTFRIVT